MRLRHISIYVYVIAGLIVWSSCSQFTEQFKTNTDLKGEKEVYVYIPTGSNFDDVKSIFDEKDILIDPAGFEATAKGKGYPKKIRPGRYKVTDGMTNKELVNMLKSGRQAPVKVSFHYVRTLPQLCGKISHKIEADSISLMKYLSDDAMLREKYGLGSVKVATMFIPNTYEFYWNTNAEEFVDRMHKEYKKFWNDDRKEKAEKLNLSPTDVTILASLVQAEQSKHQEEWPTIAGLYTNRLDKNMLLQSDPTVVYALGDFTINRVLLRHLEVESPYNTYKYSGLPPGPIVLPEPNAIDAVLDKKDHNYIFMCAKEDLSGYHNFAETLNEHNRNARRYQQALNRAGIR